MLLNLCNRSEGILRSEFRKQLLATISVTIIIYCNGIGIGWFAPMVTKLQSLTESPVGFSASVEESSWLGALLAVGGVAGNIIFGILLDLIGRKACIYLLAIPHMCLWVLVYFAPSIEYLYASRIASGITGGGTWVVIPIFIGEIADPTIRGRLTSMITLTLNAGMLTGYIFSSYVPYHIIPIAVILLPILFLLIETYFPETPPYLLHCGHEKQAEDSFKFYMNYKAATNLEIEQFNTKFTELKSAVHLQKLQSDVVRFQDFFNKRGLRAISISMTLFVISTFSGSFALLSYMSTIFMAVKTDINPDTNTVIIGVVQILGAYIAIRLVDQFGRKILLIVSTAGTGVFMACMGMYAFLVEKSNVDLSAYRSWLPLLLMALIILSANMGIISVPAIVMVEILPPKIRAKAVSFCVTFLSFVVFVMLKVFPPFMHAFGLSSAMWTFTSFAAFGVLYIVIFVPETKGRSMHIDED